MGQLEKYAKALSARIDEGDADAAVALVAHSMKLGHRKLAVRRFPLDRAMGLSAPEKDMRYGVGLRNNLPHDAIETMANEERQTALRYGKGKKSDG